jgi:hypothetical protein
MDKARCRGVPRSIGLATDLTQSCDRVVQIAKNWKATLTVVHVVEADEKEVVSVSRRKMDAEAEMEKDRSSRARTAIQGLSARCSGRLPRDSSMSCLALSLRRLPDRRNVRGIRECLRGKQYSGRGGR